MKSLPKYPGLEFLKKEAKSLRALQKQGDRSCLGQLRQCDTSLKSKTDSEIFSEKFSINNAQRIVARSYGYTSWATLKHYIESLDSPAYHGVSDKKAYHQAIVDSYDKRFNHFDNSQWHRDLAMQTVEYCPPDLGNSVLDIATGTGTIAFYTAKLVGPNGIVTGIDISKGMLQKCNEKLNSSGVKNLQFVYADAENLNFPVNNFDRIYCSSAFFWMTNPLAALRHWFELLKPQGHFGFNAWPDNSFVWGDGARRALRKYGVHFTCHEVKGNIDTTRRLMELAGFFNVRIHEVKDGRYVNANDLKGPPLRLNACAPGQISSSVG